MKLTFFRRCIFVMAVFLSPSLALGSVLGNLSASMQVGTFSQITGSVNYNLHGIQGGIFVPDEFGCGTGDFITQYADEAVYDSTRDVIRFLGRAHGNCVAGRFIRYTIATDTWDLIAWPSAFMGQGNCGSPCLSHEWDRWNTIRTSDGFQYGWEGNSIMGYNPSTNSWSAIGPPSDPPHGTATNSLEYFPEMDGTGRLVFCNGIYGCWKADPAGSMAWTYIACGEQPFSSCTGLPNFWDADATEYNTEMVYVPQKHVLIFIMGPGMWKIDAKGAFTKLANCPISCGLTEGIPAVDPVSGELIYISATNPHVWAYNLDTNQWRDTGVTYPTMLSNGYQQGNGSLFIAAPLSTYGVIWYAKYYPGTAGVTNGTWLYKHNNSVGSDFATRCAAPGVIRCFSFDTTADLGGTFGDNYGYFNNASLNHSVCNTTADAWCPEIDTTTFASGGGSLKFTQNSLTGSGGAGQWFTNFSSDLSTQFGANSQFWIQYRERVSSNLLNTHYTNSEGFKQAIIVTGDKPGCTPSTTTNCWQSCVDTTIVTENSVQRKMPEVYQSCTGSSSHGGFVHLETTFFNDDPQVNQSDISFQDRPYNYCSYLRTNGGAGGGAPAGSQFPPTGNCVPYFADEWMTFTYHITVGPRGAGSSDPTTGVPGASPNDEFVNSKIEMWVAREGQPSQKIYNHNWNISAGAPGQDQKYGKIWLLPYQTGKDNTQVTVTANAWYDELIISTQPIADPGTSTPAIGGAVIENNRNQGIYSVREKRAD